MVKILMMSAQMAALGFLKMKIFWNRCYEIITYAHDVTNKVLLQVLKYIVNVVMWPRLGNSSIFMK